MGRVVQLRRYRAVLVVGLSLAGVVVGLDLALTLLLGRDLNWHRPNIFWVYVERAGSQVAAAEDLQRAGKLPADDLVVLLGISSVLRDFDGQVLHENDAQQRRWLVLGGGGGTMTRLEVYAQALLRSPLDFGQVLIGIHPMMLWNGGTAEPLHEDIENMLQPVSPAGLRNVQAAVLEHSWLGQRWQRAFDCARVGLYRVRMALLAACGQDAGATFDPLADPWAAYQMRTADRNTPQALTLQWERLRQRCRAESYAGSDAEVAALVRVVRQLRARGTTVTIVLMPEHSRLRREIEPEVLTLLNAALAKAGGEQPLPVLDLSDALADDLFFDHSHLNERGRVRLSQSFPAWLNRDVRFAARGAAAP